MGHTINIEVEDFFHEAMPGLERVVIDAIQTLYSDLGMRWQDGVSLEFLTEDLGGEGVFIKVLESDKQVFGDDFNTQTAFSSLVLRTLLSYPIEISLDQMRIDGTLKKILGK